MKNASVVLKHMDTIGKIDFKTFNAHEQTLFHDCLFIEHSIDYIYCVPLRALVTKWIWFTVTVAFHFRQYAHRMFMLKP